MLLPFIFKYIKYANTADIPIKCIMIDLEHCPNLLIFLSHISIMHIIHSVPQFNFIYKFDKYSFYALITKRRLGERELHSKPLGSILRIYSTVETE